MKKLLFLLVACGVAGAAADNTTHAVAVRLDYDGAASVCFVSAVQPMTVEADPGDKVEWTATDDSGRCGGRVVKLANFKRKDGDDAKDPVPGCHKETTSGGPAIRCTINNANRGEVFKYDVDLPGGRGMDPEIQIRK